MFQVLSPFTVSKYNECKGEQNCSNFIFYKFENLIFLPAGSPTENPLHMLAVKGWSALIRFSLLSIAAWPYWDGSTKLLNVFICVWTYGWCKKLLQLAAKGTVTWITNHKSQMIIGIKEQRKVAGLYTLEWYPFTKWEADWFLFPNMWHAPQWCVK